MTKALKEALRKGLDVKPTRNDLNGIIRECIKRGIPCNDYTFRAYCGEYTYKQWQAFLYDWEVTKAQEARRSK